MAEKGQAKYLTAKAATMTDVKYLRKNKQMEQGARYRYAGEGAAIRLLRPAMLKHFITAAPVKVEMIHREAVATKTGGTSHYTLLRVTWRFSHAPSGEYEDVETIGEAADSGDKSCNKAMTAAKKYALLQTFLIETGDDPDEVASAQHERGAKQSAPTNGKVEPPDPFKDFVATKKAVDQHRQQSNLGVAAPDVLAAAIVLRGWENKGFASWREMEAMLGPARFAQITRAMDMNPLKFEREVHVAEEKAE